ncbi:hypothetical protein L6164_034041 [Bauhinia variegata]|uniref:Uncharacterized protein n=1 Tax=Bauhinia variegata TaxID=167791 RepID=A0ACB9KU02_BAUVA|nr:hypothetical protein L6164_034041 [Bauhinia variegata]
MQSAKKAAESVKETAANVGASAKSGMEKTKATVQEKVLFILIGIKGCFQKSFLVFFFQEKSRTNDV